MAATDCRCVLTAKDNGGSQPTGHAGIRCPAHRAKQGREARLGEHKTPTTRLGASPALPTAPQSTSAGHRPTEKGRNDAIAGVKLASARGVVDDLRPVDRLTDPNTGEAIPTSLIADDKGPFGFEHGTAPAPAASYPRQNSDHGPRTAPRERPFQRLRHKRFCRKQGR